MEEIDTAGTALATMDEFQTSGTGELITLDEPSKTGNVSRIAAETVERLMAKVSQTAQLVQASVSSDCKKEVSAALDKLQEEIVSEFVISMDRMFQKNVSNAAVAAADAAKPGMLQRFLRRRN